jgi:uncharacterized membrane protein YkoI
LIEGQQKNKLERSISMKLNRFTALALIAMLAIGVMGLISTRSLAKDSTMVVQQAQTTQVVPNNPDASAQQAEDPAIGPDTDTVEEQVGEQVEDGQPDAAEAAEGPDTDAVEEQVEDGQPDGAEVPGAEDAGPDQQDPSYTGSILIDQTATEGMSEADESAALAGQATLTSDQAQVAALAANPGATVVKVELDNENGTLVYSVELSNGSDVKVDAGNGAILHTDTGGDNEG